MQYARVPKEMEALKKELAEARAEISELRLRLNNVTLLLQQEMRESGKLPKISRSKDGKG
jgi:hypothetical protein